MSRGCVRERRWVKALFVERKMLYVSVENVIGCVQKEEVIKVMWL